MTVLSWVLSPMRTNSLVCLLAVAVGLSWGNNPQFTRFVASGPSNHSMVREHRSGCLTHPCVRLHAFLLKGHLPYRLARKAPLNRAEVIFAKRFTAPRRQTLPCPPIGETLTAGDSGQWSVVGGRCWMPCRESEINEGLHHISALRTNDDFPRLPAAATIRRVPPPNDGVARWPL